jgi:hypothetical protein
MTELDLADNRDCDFCGNLAALAYPAAPLSHLDTMTHLDGERLAVASHHDAGDWLACAPCTRLIDGERYDRLAVLAVRRLTVNGGGRHRRHSRLTRQAMERTQ